MQDNSIKLLSKKIEPNTTRRLNIKVCMSSSIEHSLIQTDIGSFQLVAYRREWNGDISDASEYVYANADEELDGFGPWEPLYTLIPND